MMSEKAQRYFDRYIQNLAVAAELDQKLADDRGWSSVVRFYAALHLINAYLVDKSNLRFDPTSSEHKERRTALERCPELRDAPDKYRRLKDFSESVRYNVGFEYTQAHNEIAMGWLDKIIAIVEPKLKKA
jgi:hypothetical protein